MAEGVDSIISQLTKTNIEGKQRVTTTTEEDEELSFAGKSLKLNTEEDAIVVTSAIRNCPKMTTLRLDGNTLGVDAAKAIGKALSSHPELQRAQWSNMFTGRLKTEVPEALTYLGGGLMLAKARLVELDLSDNALGAIGVEGFAELLKSETCYTLRELRLNNNGLGISGGKLLARKLETCYNESLAKGTPLQLKVFICGRNRLENEGATAIARFFKVIKTLEEIQMPQNGIFHDGITALAEALEHNLNLTHLNLNDNIFTEVGAEAMAKLLPNLTKLEVLNFGDCLVRPQGAKALAKAFKKCHENLKEINLAYNEINYEAAVQLVESMNEKERLSRIELNGNKIGEDGCELIRGMMETFGKPDVIGSLSEDEGDEDDEDDDDDDEDADGAEEEDDENPVKPDIEGSVPHIKCTVLEFLAEPTAARLVGLGEDRAELILKEINKDPEQKIEKTIDVFSNLSTAIDPYCKEMFSIASECVDVILEDVFRYADEEKTLHILSNTILVHIGLIKSEDKKFKPPSDLSGCLLMLEHAVRQPYFQKSTKEIIKMFLSRLNRAIEQSGQIKHQLMQTLYAY